MSHSLSLRALGLLLISLLARSVSAAELVVDDKLHHVRAGNEREWSEFAPQAESSKWQAEFAVPLGFKPHVLLLRQRDVKQQTWKLTLDDKPLGKLLPDENDTVASWLLPAELAVGRHVLVAQTDSKKSDDIQIGEARILEEADWKAGLVSLSVVDVDTQKPLPCRITVATQNGSLMALGAASNDKLAVRPGVVYTSDGHAEFTLPKGRYRVFASRGFEYGVQRVDIDVRPGERLEKSLRIRRETPTPGYVSCDTHCHTFQFSKHGDATLDERLLTLAGEGIEWPIATDHNLQVDYDARSRELGLRQFFTPLVGSEVTTKVGHFNVFPLQYPSEPIDFKGNDWAAVSAAIGKAGPEVIILNHARDLHSGFRPFGPDHRVAASGENLDGWKLGANAMEVVNSGATQTDPLQLFQDWMTSLNRGQLLTPIGSSDSHDVSRFIVGQGRTYVRCRDEDPGKIDTSEALQALREGRVLVSMGLLTELTVNDRYRSGELVPGEGTLKLHVCVSGPSWVKANRLLLYLNGELFDDRTISATSEPLDWENDWEIPRPQHDAHLVAIALGPGVAEPFWTFARPYQPTSDDPQTYGIGCSGAIFIDADHSGKFQSAHELAQGIVKDGGADLRKMLDRLAGFDEATAIQAASIFQASGQSILSDEVDRQLESAAPHVRRGFRRYRESWKQSIKARQEAGLAPSQ